MTDERLCSVLLCTSQTCTGHVTFGNAIMRISEMQFLPSLVHLQKISLDSFKRRSLVRIFAPAQRHEVQDFLLIDMSVGGGIRSVGCRLGPLHFFHNLCFHRKTSNQ